MLVYSIHLHLRRPEELDHYFAAVSRWVSRKTRSTVSAKQVRGPYSRQFRDSLSTKLESWVASVDGELSHAVRLTHGDSEVGGRQWNTELGLRAADGNPAMRFSALVETREVSTLVQSPISLRRPRIVGDLIADFGVTASTPGAANRYLTAQNASDLLSYEVLDTAREHAIVIVSPTVSGKYLVDPSLLREQSCGLADVWAIPPAADTWTISRLMKDVPAPYHGAVTILLPRRRQVSRDFVPSRVLTASEIEAMPSPELHVLELLAHRFNLPNSWKHTSPDRVRERLRAASLTQLRSSLASSQEKSAYEALFSQVAEEEAELRKQLAQTETERDDFFLQLEDVSDQLRRLRYENEQLQQQLTQSRATKKPGATLSDELRKAVHSAVLQAPSVLDALTLAELLFPDRLLVLADASKSAKDHDRFQFGSDVFALLYKLATDYWTALAAGIPDAEARKVFGQHEFAAKEAGLSKNGRRARTFDVPGQGELFMEPHLKIQRGPNEAESWRCHFEWLATQKRIVVGHCGVHLPM